MVVTIVDADNFIGFECAGPESAYFMVKMKVIRLKEVISKS